jgi:hypothetical protein
MTCLPSPRRSAEDENPLQRHLEQPFPTSEHVLLCSFGAQLNDERTTRELRLALVDAGFAPAQAGHLIRTSPLLRPVVRDRYQLRTLRLLAPLDDASG